MSLYAKKEGVIAARPFEPSTDGKYAPSDREVIIGDMLVWDPKNEAEKSVMSLGEFEALYVALHHRDDDRPRSPEEAKKLQAERDAEQRKLAEQKAAADANPAVQAAKGPASPSGDSRPMTDLAAAQAAQKAHVGVSSQEGGAAASASGQGAQDSDQVKGEKK